MFLTLDLPCIQAGLGNGKNEPGTPTNDRIITDGENDKATSTSLAWTGPIEREKGKEQEDIDSFYIFDTETNVSPPGYDINENIFDII